MKQLKYVSLFLLAVVLSASFTSCSDDEKVIERAELVGEWQCIIDEGYEKHTTRPQYDDEWNERDPVEIDEKIEFKADGTMIFNDISRHTWSLKEDILVMVYKEGTSTETIESKVLKLTSKELILERYETSTDEDGGKNTFWNKMTFKKTK